MGYRMVLITPDSPNKIRNTRKKLDISLPMYSDPSMDAAKKFGIAYEQTSERGHARLEEYSGQDHHLLPVPSVFLVGVEGRIVFSYVNPDYRVRIPPELLVDAARAFAGGSMSGD